MKRWLLIAVAVVMTLGSLTLAATPAMARDSHSRRTHETVRDHGKRRNDSHRSRDDHREHGRERGHRR
jgi:Ni/Co efflux regulator RcnB